VTNLSVLIFRLIYLVTL